MNPTEPAADVRIAAHMLRETFIALIAEGFTERQALMIVGQILAASSGSQSRNPG